VAIKNHNRHHTQLFKQIQQQYCPHKHYQAEFKQEPKNFKLEKENVDRTTTTTTTSASSTVTGAQQTTSNLAFGRRTLEDQRVFAFILKLFRAKTNKPQLPNSPVKQLFLNHASQAHGLS